ncbi:MAG: hypothetical protein H7Y86_05915 [Rhizobacter sp.]|nr:hypothetical protein [Ferruginibacter sp.]
MQNEEKFSNNREENLRIENELIRIKMNAQFGETFQMEIEAGLPPEIENQFLKNILAFEEQFHSGNAKTISIYEKIGKPGFKTFRELSPAELEPEIERLMRLLNRNSISLDFIHGPYSNEIVYRFITEEFFEEQTDEMELPGMMHGYIYEEFHPNNKAEIEENTHEFFKDWLTMNFNEYSGEMDDHFINAKSEKMSRETVYKKIKLFSDCYTEFKNDAYNIDHIQADEQPDGNFLGFSEGMYKFEAVLESGEEQRFEGPFKLYMRRKDNYWSIFYFVIPGFEL